MKLITQILILLIISVPILQKEYLSNYEKPNIEIENSPIQTEWTIQTQNDMGTIYKGNQKLEGWLIYKEKYGAEDKVPHFHISENSIKKLPEELQEKIPSKPYLQNFIILPEDQKIIENLSNHSKEDPATIRVDELILTMEGPPFLNLIEILD